MNPSSIPNSVRQTIESLSFPESGCWIWNGETSSAGTPVVYVGSEMVPAKMVFYHFLHEELEDLPQGHSYRFYMGQCDNKLCVKPEPYEHVVCRQGLKPGPRKRAKRTKSKVPWDRNRALRIYYGHVDTEIRFQKELNAHINQIESLVLALKLTYKDCINWAQLTECFDYETEYYSDIEFQKLSASMVMSHRSLGKMWPLPVKRALYNCWKEEADYLLLPGFQRIGNGCKDKDCYAPWHLKASIRNPGTQSAKTEWITHDYSSR